MDKSTTAQCRVSFDRICVEIKADELPPKSILFIDEYDQKCSSEVIYEWTPSSSSFFFFVN